MKKQALFSILFLFSCVLCSYSQINTARLQRVKMDFVNTESIKRAVNFVFGGNQVIVEDNVVLQSGERIDSYFNSLISVGQYDTHVLTIKKGCVPGKPCGPGLGEIIYTYVYELDLYDAGMFSNIVVDAGVLEVSFNGVVVTPKYAIPSR